MEFETKKSLRDFKSLIKEVEEKGHGIYNVKIDYPDIKEYSSIDILNFNKIIEELKSELDKLKF